MKPSRTPRPPAQVRVVVQATKGFLHDATEVLDSRIIEVREQWNAINDTQDVLLRAELKLKLVTDIWSAIDDLCFEAEKADTHG